MKGGGTKGMEAGQWEVIRPKAWRLVDGGDATKWHGGWLMEGDGEKRAKREPFAQNQEYCGF